MAARHLAGVEVAPGAEVSFLDTIGAVSRAQGYQEGQAIVGGVVTTSVGGGICYVSTALYRAAFLAGLPITERHPHSLVLASFNDIPGFDAAVDTSGLDLRWRNDTPYPIVVTTDLSEGQLTVTLWGQGDGRTTTLRGPTLRTNATTRNATISRMVTDANGTVIRSESVQSVQSFRTASTPRRTQSTAHRAGTDVRNQEH